MDELSSFLTKLVKHSPTPAIPGNLSPKEARGVVQEINEFLFTNYKDIGEIIELGDSYEYFSDFHKYWSNNYKEILDIKIDDEQCEEVAKILHKIYIKSKGDVFKEVYDAKGLSPEDICKIRFLTANQDFRGSMDFAKLVAYFNDDKSIFDVTKIYDDPARFINDIGITDLSQNDKRINYAKNICKFLNEKQITPFEILSFYNNDLVAVRQAIIKCLGAGYGDKKTDMFIRDMVVLGVWKQAKNFDAINVASDVNTVKVALRTGILKTAIPLLSSFMDIFCYQYGYVDTMNAKAWRRVWEKWRDLYPDDKIDSPCLMDYFIYRVIGKQFCINSLAIFECANGHHFKWHSTRNRTCQECYRKGDKHVLAKLVGRVMPCLDKEGEIAIRETEFVKNNSVFSDMKNCPFINICCSNNSMMLQPPKSISIKGRTGWETAYARRGAGGGGLMS